VAFGDWKNNFNLLMVGEKTAWVLGWKVLPLVWLFPDVMGKLIIDNVEKLAMY
jgi:hypothetical protein